MIYLTLAIVSSMAVAVVMRLSEKHISNNISMLASNYLMCSVLAGLYAGGLWGSLAQPGTGFAAALGVVSGAFYLLGFMLYQWDIRVNGVTLSALFMKMGVIVSILTAVCFFGEVPGALQVAGMLIACAAILVIHLEKGSSRVKSGVGLIALFIAGGLTDAMAKVYEELGVSALKNGYLLFTFVSAFVLSVAICLYKKQGLKKVDLGFGLLIGIPNYFSARFLLYSLSQVPAVIAYPTYSVGSIVAVMLVSRVVFGERLSRRQIIALVMILVALVLLNV